jgi:hypothetical protein
MRALIVMAAALAALISMPADAGPRHVHTAVSFGYSYGYPFGYGFYRPYYSPWYSPWYGGTVGFGVRVAPRATVRTERGLGDQRALKLFVYPAAGQSDAQTADDRYECHVWAADRSGYDPTLGARSRDDAEDYTRAFTACMEGRNYVVK